MNALFLVFLGLVGFASAQIPYSCAPGICSSASGYDRADVLGCMYFCYLDVVPSETLDRGEFHTRYGEWIAAAGTADCDEACFVNANRDIIPACDNELAAAFERMAVLDNSNSTISHADVDLWYDQVVAIQGSEPVLPDGFQRWFRVLYFDISDPACSLPYP